VRGVFTAQVASFEASLDTWLTEGPEIWQFGRGARESPTVSSL
jgi:hypothetical protein